MKADKIIAGEDPREDNDKMEVRRALTMFPCALVACVVVLL